MLRNMSDPYDDYESYSEDEINLVLDSAGKLWGQGFVAQLKNGLDQWHEPKDPRSTSTDPLQMRGYRKSPRMTAAGKANKTDLQGFKRNMRSYPAVNKGPGRGPDRIPEDIQRNSTTPMWATIIESFGSSAPFTPQELALIQKVVSGSMEYGRLPDALRTKLYTHFMPEMPYGVAKAREGDPDEWIEQHLEDLL